MDCNCTNKINSSLYRGDDTLAFGGNFIRIDIENNTQFNIIKAEWKCGVIKKVFNNPQFPLMINLTSDESEKLNTQNTCYLAVYDDLGRKKTCEGSLTFTSNQKRV